MCKNCGHELNERKNYNWSCKIHVSEYSGPPHDMWWYCLNKGFCAPGCKMQKHEIKDEDYNDEEEDKVKKGKSMKIRCQSCKELSHEV